MKKLYFTYLFFTLTCTLMFSQNGKITYKTVLTFSTEKIPNDSKEMMNKIISNANKQNFELLFNQNKSVFNIIDNISAEDKYIEDIARSGFTSFSKVFTDIGNSQIYEVMNDGIVTSTKIDNTLWNITKESRVIDKYNCFKALYTVYFFNRNGEKTSRIVTAWFAPSLP